MTEHTVSAFGEELDRLETMVMQMGGLAEKQIEHALEALKKNDSALAQRAVSDDRLLDMREAEVNDCAMNILALRQPMALDLRETVTAIKIASDLERIGDLARNVARRVIHGNAVFLERMESGVLRMGQQALRQIKDVLDAYSRRDLEKAMRVWEADQELDKMYNSVLREMLTYMMEDSENLTPALQLLFAAKHIERAGDHSTNIAESIVFMITGKPLDEDRPKESRV